MVGENVVDWGIRGCVEVAYKIYCSDNGSRGFQSVVKRPWPPKDRNLALCFLSTKEIHDLDWRLQACLCWAVHISWDIIISYLQSRAMLCLDGRQTIEFKMYQKCVRLLILDRLQHDLRGLGSWITWCDFRQVFSLLLTFWILHDTTLHQNTNWIYYLYI